MELSAFFDIKTHGNGQIGKKGCRQIKGMSGKLADIDVSARHVANMLLTFPTKPNGSWHYEFMAYPSTDYRGSTRTMTSRGPIVFKTKMPTSR
jgi:hypothetical protein